MMFLAAERGPHPTRPSPGNQQPGAETTCTRRQPAGSRRSRAAPPESGTRAEGFRSQILPPRRTDRCELFSATRRLERMTRFAVPQAARDRAGLGPWSLISVGAKDGRPTRAAAASARLHSFISSSVDRPSFSTNASSFSSTMRVYSVNAAKVAAETEGHEGHPSFKREMAERAKQRGPGHPRTETLLFLDWFDLQGGSASLWRRAERDEI